MKQFIYLFSGLLLLFASTPRVVAQEIGDYSQLNDEDYSKINLPPLSVLFENAKNNPIYELADAKTAIERKLLQKEKWAFLGFFSLRGKLSIWYVRQRIYLYRCGDSPLPHLFYSGAKRLYAGGRCQHSVK